MGSGDANDDQAQAGAKPSAGAQRLPTQRHSTGSSADGTAGQGPAPKASLGRRRAVGGRQWAVKRQPTTTDDDQHHRRNSRPAAM